MQLSGRLKLLASKVTAGNRLADVGTDHGYVPIALVLEGRISSAVAMDVNRGPLERAEEHIAAYGLGTYIETRLSDGLRELKEGEADTVLIAGMGGRLTRRILQEGEHCLSSVKELILQPQSEIWLVREYLFCYGYKITEEDIVREDGKFYPMLKAAHGREEACEPWELRYGRMELQRSPEVLRIYLEKERRLLEKIWRILEKKGQEGSRRMQEVDAQLREIEKALGKWRYRYEMQ